MARKSADPIQIAHRLADLLSRPARPPSQQLPKAFKELESWANSKSAIERERIPQLSASFQQALDAFHQAPRNRIPPSIAGKLHFRLHGLLARSIVADLVLQHRVAHGLSLDQLAEKVELTQPYLGQIERCAAGLPSIESAQLLLEELNLPPLAQFPAETGSVVSEQEVHKAGHLRHLISWAARLSEDDIVLLTEIAKAVLQSRGSTSDPTLAT